MTVLGALCIAIAVSGYAVSSVPAAIFLTADGLIKLSFGIWMLFFSKPTCARR